MYTDPTVGGSLSSSVWFLGELAFKWIPGTVIALVAGTDAGTPVPLSPITQPVTYSDVARYISTVTAPSLYPGLYNEWQLFTALSIVVSLVFAAIIIYSAIRIQQVRHLEHVRFASAAHTVTARDVPKTVLRWRRIMEQISSDSEENWRLAILEADIMLNELLDMQGYKGETMADKMRLVDRGDFNSIDIAWEAHKIRNRIAHEGSAHLLNSREARRVIGLYERIFKEFRFIE